MNLRTAAEFPDERMARDRDAAPGVVGLAAFLDAGKKIPGRLLIIR
ncbi:MAG: hypothetical protein ABSB32_10215 [Thermodesulfobacteriota bacterium]